MYDTGQLSILVTLNPAACGACLIGVRLLIAWMVIAMIEGIVGAWIANGSCCMLRNGTGERRDHASANRRGDGGGVGEVLASDGNASGRSW